MSKMIFWIAACSVSAWFTYWLGDKGFNVLSIITGAVLGIAIEDLYHSIQDISDTKDWKKEQRKLKRGRFIDDNSLIRISFAYIFRVKVDGKFLLVMNSRHTGKYQPVGGVYKMEESERQFLTDSFGCMDDKMIPIDSSSKNDYRLRVKNKYLRRFVRRFNSKKSVREKVDNLSREFREELIETGILPEDVFGSIKYSYVGRYYNGVKFTPHFSCYELLMGDVVTLIANETQQDCLRRLMNESSNTDVAFFTDEQIGRLGVGTVEGALTETIADHALNILESKQDELDHPYKKGEVYTATITEERA